MAQSAGRPPSWRDTSQLSLLKQGNLHHKLLHQTSQQPPMRRNPSLLSGENKPETSELFKAGVTDAERPGGQVQAGSQTWHLQARRACPKGLSSPPVWHSTRSLTQLQHTKCTLSQERYSAPTLNWELLINSQCSLFTPALKSCFKTSDSS